MGKYVWQENLPHIAGGGDPSGGGGSGSGAGSTPSTVTSVTQVRNKTTVPALTSVSGIQYQYALASAAAEAKQEEIPVKPFVLRLTGNTITYPIIPGSVSFSWGAGHYFDSQGSVFKKVGGE